MGDPEKKFEGILKSSQIIDAHGWGQIVGVKRRRMRSPERQ